MAAHITVLLQFDVTPARSRNMAAMARRDTNPEVMLRRELRLLGLRGYRKHVSLPGKPDLLFPRVGLVVFVDGCFWHGCPRHFKAPKSNAKYWTEKISYNKARDRRNDRRLRRLGYSVVHVWQHRIISDPARAAKAIASALDRRAFTSCQGEC